MLRPRRDLFAVERELESFCPLREGAVDQFRQPLEAGRVDAGRGHRLPGDLVGEPFAGAATGEPAQRAVGQLFGRRSVARPRRHVPHLQMVPTAPDGAGLLGWETTGARSMSAAG
jgi:hypothetical protein